MNLLRLRKKAAETATAAAWWARELELCERLFLAVETTELISWRKTPSGDYYPADDTDEPGELIGGYGRRFSTLDGHTHTPWKVFDTLEDLYTP